MRTRKLCKEEGCESLADAKGMCGKHYTRHRRRAQSEKISEVRRARYLLKGDEIREQKKKRYHELGEQSPQLKYYRANAAIIAKINAKKRRPADLIGWAKHVRHKALVNESQRRRKGREPSVVFSLDEAIVMIAAELENGSIEFGSAITAPSADQIKCRKGYSANNIQIVPCWLNYAYHDWDKEEVEQAILRWAKRKLGI